MTNNFMNKIEKPFVASKTYIACSGIAECFMNAEYTNPIIYDRLFVAGKVVLKNKENSFATDQAINPAPEDGRDAKITAALSPELSKLQKEKENFMMRFERFLSRTAWEKEDFSDYRCRINVVLSEKSGNIRVETGLLDFTVEINEKGWFTFKKDYDADEVKEAKHHRPSKDKLQTRSGNRKAETKTLSTSVASIARISA